MKIYEVYQAHPYEGTSGRERFMDKEYALEYWKKKVKEQNKGYGDKVTDLDKLEDYKLEDEWGYKSNNYDPWIVEEVEVKEL